MSKPSCYQNYLQLSFITTPFLLGLAMVNCLTEGLIELGKNSEEVFRGERLPILKFPIKEGKNE
jgi:hypothetical protein